MNNKTGAVNRSEQCEFSSNYVVIILTTSI